MVLGNKAGYTIALWFGIVLVSSLLDMDSKEFRWQAVLLPLAMFLTWANRIHSIRNSKKSEG